MIETPFPITPSLVAVRYEAIPENPAQGLRQHYSQQCENLIRRAPAASMLTAVAAGYCLHQVPLRSVFSTQWRLLSALALPALVVAAAATFRVFLQNQTKTKQT